jgi:hypothetical protein
VNMPTAASTYHHAPGTKSQMQDVLDKALEDHRLNVNIEENPPMKWLYKQPTKKINM